MKKLIIFWILLLCSLVRANVLIGSYRVKPPYGTSLVSPIDPNLVAYWVMNENTGTTIADLSGNSNTGTFGAAPNNPSWTTGNFNGPALSFDGTGDYIDCGNNPSTRLSTELTMAVWVWPNGADESGYILSKFAVTITGYALYWSGDTDKILMYYGDGSTSKSLSTSTIFTDNQQWVHFAFVKDSAGNVRFYRNGIAAGTGTGVTIAVNTVDNVLIGNRTGGIQEAHFFKGLVDNVKIYNRALTQPEITNLYNHPFKDFPKKVVMIGGKVIMP